jgi:tetratricopeptide (TPR) repeat protein
VSALSNLPSTRFLQDARLPALILVMSTVCAATIGINRLMDSSDFAALNGKVTPPVTASNRANHARAQIETEIKQRFAQGVLMLHAKQYEHALTAFHRVLQLAPEMPEAHVDIGYALNGLQQYAMARDFFEGALALRKNQLNAYYGLAESLEAMNDLPGAIGAMRTYIHLTPATDPFRRKAEAAVWEWEGKVKQGQGMN